MSDLKGRIALVIGASAGIGRATCQALAARGALVIVADRDEAGAERVAEELRAGKGKAVAYRVDFGSLAEVQALFAWLEAEYGRLNVLFSNVGVRCASGFEVSEVEFSEAITMNLKNHFFATNFAADLLRKGAPHASVIYMASGAGLRYFGRSPLYSISKSGLIMMMRTFARRFAPEGIRVNAVCPGPIETGFSTQGADPETQKQAVARLIKDIPMGRIGLPEDVASLVGFLASDEAAYLTGLSIPVDGGAFA